MKKILILSALLVLTPAASYAQNVEISTFSVDLTKKTGVISIEHRFSGTSSDCTLSVYGSDKSDMSNAITLRSIGVISPALTFQAVNKRKVNRKRKNGKRNKKTTAYIQSQVVCPTNSSTSEVVTLKGLQRVRGKRIANARRWLTTLEKALNE